MCLLLSFFFLHCSGHHRDLHSFPTRRSSDLAWDPVSGVRSGGPGTLERPLVVRVGGAGPQGGAPAADAPPCGRSEEHTSELQSRLHLVCRLLLEKKKTEEPAMYLVPLRGSAL